MSDDAPRPITLQDIAEQAGISVSTVSRALSGHKAISEDTRQLVRDLAEQNKYQPARKPKLARADDSRSITLVMPLLPSETNVLAESFSLNLLAGIGTAMREKELKFSIAYQVPRDNDSLAAFLDSNPVGGFIFLSQTQFHDALNRYARQGRAFSVWGAQMEDQDYCSIGTDNVSGGHRATSHLLRLGRRRIVYLGACNSREIDQRIAGYRSALEAHGVPVDPQMIAECGLTYDAAFEAIDDLLDSGTQFDGVVAASDTLAFGAIRALHRRGVQVPRDVSVVGYDDLEQARYAHPALTTIRQDVLKAGRLLVSKVLRQLSGFAAPSERVRTELVVRESCGG